MLEEFAYLGKEKAYEVVVRNTNLVADWCEDVVPLPRGCSPPNRRTPAEELTSLVWGKAKALYGEEPPKIVVDRINAELGDIIKCKYDVIYMSAQKLVQDSLAHGYLVGSRGSVGSSLVAFMSGITEVNSLPPHYRCPKCKHSDFDTAKEKGIGCGADMPDAVCPVCGTPYAKDGFNIPFETFLGFGGDKVPDIDLNFSGEYQANAHRYTIELFGETHVFRAGTIGTVAEKTAYGYVKKYLDERGMTADRAEENRLAQGCAGVKRTTGQHPGGLVVVPDDIGDRGLLSGAAPRRTTADSDTITTHFEYHSMEDNLLKLDMLGHDDPTIMRMLQDLTGVDPARYPLDDRDTMSIFTSSKCWATRTTRSWGPPAPWPSRSSTPVSPARCWWIPSPRISIRLLRLSGFSHGTDVWLGNARDLIVNRTRHRSADCGLPRRHHALSDLLWHAGEAAFKIMESVRKGRGRLRRGWRRPMRAAACPDWYIGSWPRSVPVPQGPRRGLRDDGLPHRLVQGPRRPWPSTPPSSLSAPRPSTPPSCARGWTCARLKCGRLRARRSPLPWRRIFWSPLRWSMSSICGGSPLST